MGGISIWQIAIVLILVVLLFGTSKLRNVGSDLGSALKGFKKAMNEDDEKSSKDAEFQSIEKSEQASTLDPQMETKEKVDKE